MARSRFVRLAGIAVLMALAFGAGSFASALGESTPDTYSACVSATNDRIPRSLYDTLGNASLYNVTVNDTPLCQSGDNIISWNAQGPVGLTGATGPVGATGAIGPSGVTGAVGPVGATGVIGPAGAIGPVGATGVIGPTGAIGPVGATGATGQTGADGATGAMGPAGAMGAIGPKGDTGPAGPTGQPGANGAVGATGPEGPAGLPGAAGTTGPKGDTGPAGPTDAAGAYFAVDSTAQTCTKLFGPAYVHCTYVKPGEYSFTIDAPGIGPLPLIAPTGVSTTDTLSIGEGGTGLDGGYSTDIFTSSGTDVGIFTVVIVSAG